MCGLSAVLINSNDTSSHHLKTIYKMTETIRHRGPDDEGYVLFENNNQKPIILKGKDTLTKNFKDKYLYVPERGQNSSSDDIKLILGHRRLSIQDISLAGHQPMCDESGRYWIIFNGEIYNYKKLKKNLIDRGIQFLSSSDTEIILKYYIEFGVDCFQKFKGMWSLIIYDNLNNEILLSRDRFGIKPLYYYISPKNDIYFASEIKQFTKIPSWRSKLNINRAYDYLLYSQIDHTDETMFKDVFQCPQGHFININLDNNKYIGKKLTAKKWYELTNYKNTKDEGFVQNKLSLRKLIESSIDEHKISDVPISYSLSGGLDSSILVLSDYNRSRDKIKTYSIFSKNKEVDESKWVNEAIKNTNIKNKNTYLETNEYFKELNNILWSLDEPFNDNTIFSQWKLMKLIKEDNFKVNIIGQGADEILAGYDNYYYTNIFYLLKNFKFFSFLNEVHFLSINKNISYLRIFKTLIGKLLPNFITSIYHKRKNSRILQIKKYIRIKPEHNYKENSNFHTDKINSVLNLNKLNISKNSLPKLLRYADRTSMYNSIEVRVPYLDHEVVEFCLNIPSDFIIKNGLNKFILRHSFKDIISNNLFERKDKIGFIPYNDNKLVKAEYDFFLKELASALDNCKDIFNKNILELLKKDYIYNNKVDPFVFRIIIFSNWFKLFEVDL